ncbi:MAG: carboxypeptidase-like regulatory domain-containing protein [Phycisphaerales bacterium]
MNRPRCLLLISLTLLLIGCQTPTPMHASFNEADYTPFAGVGTGRIEGQAFATTRGGLVIKAAGREVHAVPKTTYSEEIIQRLFVGNDPPTSTDPASKKFTRRTMADADGRFEFSNLPPGEYYVTCRIVWEYSSGNETGGNAYTLVTVQNGQTTKALVTR